MPGKSFIISLLGFVVMLSSCYDETNTYGQNLVNSAIRNITIDTSTVVITSVQMDSIETSGAETALIGQYTHKDWGTMRSCSYIAYSRPTYSTDADYTVTLDSMVLRLAFNGHSIGDTAKEQRFTVHRLNKQIVLNDNGYLYNTSTVDYDPEVLGQFTFKPKPNSGDEVKIRLSDEFGKDILRRFHTDDNEVSADHFEDYFKGIVILPDEQVCSSIQAFSVNDSLPAITVYYHALHIGDQEFSIYPKKSTQFNHIDYDREGSLLGNYPATQKEFSSGELNGMGFLFAGLGWYSRLEFPSLNDIMRQGEIVGIESAYLIIRPVSGSYSGLNKLPENLYLYIADENSVVVDAVKDYLGSEVQAGTLEKDGTFDGAYPDKLYYYFDVTSFLQEELGTLGKYKHSLQLVFDDDQYTKTFNNLTFGDSSNELPITLRLTYKIYESY